GPHHCAVGKPRRSSPLGHRPRSETSDRFGCDASKYQRPREVARRPRGALAAGSCSTYRFPPWERVSAEIKENVQPLPDDFSVLLFSFRKMVISASGQHWDPGRQSDGLRDRVRGSCLTCLASTASNNSSVTTSSAGLGWFGRNRMRFIHNFLATILSRMTIGSKSVASPCPDSFATVF